VINASALAHGKSANRCSSALAELIRARGSPRRFFLGLIRLGNVVVVRRAIRQVPLLPLGKLGKHRGEKLAVLIIV